jgi:hypothetical protein
MHTNLLLLHYIEGIAILAFPHGSLLGRVASVVCNFLVELVRELLVLFGPCMYILCYVYLCFVCVFIRKLMGSLLVLCGAYLYVYVSVCMYVHILIHVLEAHPGTVSLRCVRANIHTFICMCELCDSQCVCVCECITCTYVFIFACFFPVCMLTYVHVAHIVAMHVRMCRVHIRIYLRTYICTKRMCRVHMRILFTHIYMHKSYTQAH